MLPTLSPQEFVAKWRKADVKERSAAREHFIALRADSCEGVPVIY